MKSTFSILGVCFGFCVIFSAMDSAMAAIQSEKLEYKDGETALEGLLVWDDQFKSPRPGVMVIHQWLGLGDYEKKRAEMLAGLGYIAFAADIYGKGVRPSDRQEAGAFAGKYKIDRTLLRSRTLAALEAFRRQPQVDPQQIAAIGYCFGGTAVIEMARAGADVKGVVSFHGGLDSPEPAKGKAIKTKLLILHGADDPHVPTRDIEAFEAEMKAGGVDYTLTAYPGAVHSFTQWHAGNDPSQGAAYNKEADEKSWEAMKKFFEEIFGEAGNPPK
jgi:dienelactone hydrolase